MKTRMKTRLILLVILLNFSFCDSQQIATVTPKPVSTQTITSTPTQIPLPRLCTLHLEINIVLKTERGYNYDLFGVGNTDLILTQKGNDWILSTTARHDFYDYLNRSKIAYMVDNMSGRLEWHVFNGEIELDQGWNFPYREDHVFGSGSCPIEEGFRAEFPIAFQGENLVQTDIENGLVFFEMKTRTGSLFQFWLSESDIKDLMLGTYLPSNWQRDSLEFLTLDPTAYLELRTKNLLTGNFPSQWDYGDFHIVPGDLDGHRIYDLMRCLPYPYYLSPLVVSTMTKNGDIIGAIVDGRGAP